MYSCPVAQRGTDWEGQTTGRTNDWVERNLNRDFEVDSGSDGSAQDNDSQPLFSQSSPQNTSESSELANDAASFMRYNQMAKRIQKRVEATLQAEVQKIRQESREERQRHAEEMKAAKAREDDLKRMVLTLQVDNPEAKIQADALRDQTRLAECRRRRCRGLRGRAGTDLTDAPCGEQNGITRLYTHSAREDDRSL